MSAEAAPILVVDDDEVSLTYYKVIIETLKLGDPRLCQDSREVMPLLKKEGVSLVLLDLHMPHISGQELLEKIKTEYSDLPVIVVTAEEAAETAVHCMKRGAFDYLVKPVDRNRLMTVIKHALEVNLLEREVKSLSRQMLSPELRNPEAFEAIVTQSSSMRSIFHYIEAIAGSPKPVLITGESGSGKELIARAVYNVSKVQGDFVAVNVSGLDDTVFSDTLFGHKKGAFTGADAARKGLIDQAAGGMLFLDEIGDLQMSSQIKLLRLLQEGDYYPLGSDSPEMSSARVIVATNAILKDRQEAGDFRSDLYFRLMAHHIDLPPLRERLEDLPFLIEHFLQEASSTLERRKPSVPPELNTLLKTYHFPGNVRELQSMIFDAVSRHDSSVLPLSFFREYTGKPRQAQETGDGLPGGEQIFYTGPFPTLKEVEEFFMQEALKKAQGNQTIAAQLLGVSQSTLSRRLSAKRGT
jgi:DNA-binding NtrC family response regulator